MEKPRLTVFLIFIKYSHLLLEIGAGPRALQNFLDIRLDTVPIRAVEALQDDAEILGNRLESLEVLVARD